VNKVSLSNIRHKFILEVKEHIPDKPIILVGAQKDLRDEATPTDPEHVTTLQGQELAEELKLDKYFEVSALKDPEGLK